MNAFQLAAYWQVILTTYDSDIYWQVILTTYDSDVLFFMFSIGHTMVDSSFLEENTSLFKVLFNQFYYV